MANSGTIHYIFHDGTGLLISLKERRIRDPIYGYIHISPIERKIVDSEFVQRLRSIRQLQVAHIVYPSATHTRFHHSLGVMHLGGMFAFHLIANTAAKLGVDLKKLEIKDPKDLFSIIEGVRISGLLHDLGHGPFSHAFDSAVIKQCRKLHDMGVYNHEVLGYKIYQVYLREQILKETENYKDILYPESVIETIDYILAPHEIASKMTRTRRIIRVLRKVIRDAFFSADIIDFILRDAYYTGVIEYGTVDYKRLITNAYLIPPGSPKEEFEIVFSERVKDTIRNILFSRFWLYNNVYLHKTVRLFEHEIKELMKLLRPVFERILINTITGKDNEAFLKLTDENLLEYFPENYLKKDSPERKRAEEIIKTIKRREKKWKLIYTEEIPLTPSIKEEADKIIYDNRDKFVDVNTLRVFREEKEKELADLLKTLREKIIHVVRRHYRGFGEDDIWIDLPPIKFVPIISHVLIEGDLVIRFLTKVGKEVGENPKKFIKDERISDLLYAWPQVITPMRIYLRKKKNLEKFLDAIRKEVTSLLKGKKFGHITDEIIKLQYMIARLELPETA